MYVTPLGRDVRFERLILPPPGHCDETVVIVAGSNVSTQFHIEDVGVLVPENESASFPITS